MSSSNNTDFKKLAAEADSEREKELKTRKEAQLLKQEIDRQNNEDYENEKCDSAHLESNASDITLSSKYSSRNSSVEPSELDAKIKETEEKWKAILGQHDAEKEALLYQLSLVRDQIDDLNENQKNMQKELSEKRKENAYQKFCITDLNNRMNNLKSEIEIRDKLIVDNNLILLNDCDLSNNAQVNQVHESSDDPDSNSSNIAGTALLSKDVVDKLRELSQNSLECCIRALFDEKTKFSDEIKALRRKLSDNDSEFTSLKEVRMKHSVEEFDALKQNYHNAKTQAQEYKRQLQASQQKATGLEADVIRLEGQVKRYKTIAASCEKQEEDLKQTSRKYQKECREAQSKIEDLKSENASLTKKLAKLKEKK